jgi:2-polyprenyl-3-methyl-5-hydroxy-6-metoxy-1,4-benzoquinol methylase
MEQQHICPWWLGYFLINPLRKLMQNPYKILAPYVKDNMRVIDFGSGMGYFSLPLAKLVGANGNVYCIDLQQKMLDKLMKRAHKKKFSHIITPVQCRTGSYGMEKQTAIDFILLFAVVHEVPDSKALFSACHQSLKKGGCVLFSEPKAHIKKSAFKQSLNEAEAAGFSITTYPDIRGGISALLLKK